MTKDRPRVAYGLVLEPEQRARAIEHSAAGGMQDPVTNVLALEALGVHEHAHHLAEHRGADPANVLGKDDARPPARILEAHRIQVLGTKQRAMCDHARPGA